MPAKKRSGASLRLRGTSRGLARALAPILMLSSFALFQIATIEPSQAQTYSLLYSFAGTSDGGRPNSLVLDPAGNLYGTTTYGGELNCGAPHGCGTVFKLDTTGKETVLYSFKGLPDDGEFPYSGLVMDDAGNLYGTTSQGGGGSCGDLRAPISCGTVFKLDRTGKETVLYGFKGLPDDGGLPYSGLVMDDAGNLYGTTSQGGGGTCTGLFGVPVGCGVVFKLDTTGKETVLHSFGGDDGEGPGSLVSDAADNLYGTAGSGGSSTYGTVFKLDTTGNVIVLYSFKGLPDDGALPGDLVMDGAGNLYGPTAEGGSGPCVWYNGLGPVGCGVVFKLDMTGKETVLYSFKGSPDGAVPSGLVWDASGNLYGTTDNSNVLTPQGPQTLFKIDMTGRLTVLHNFVGSPSDGRNPAGLIQDSAGNLYGTTGNGGAFDAGTVFKLTQPSFLLSASTFAPITVSPGASSASTIHVTALGGFSGAVTLSCSVQPSPDLAPKCSISPSSATPGTAATLTVSTTGPTAGVLPSNAGSGPFSAVWLPLIGLVAARVRRRSEERKKRIVSAMALALVLFVGLEFDAACGGSGGSNASGSTPAGTYTITVTGTSGVLQHSIDTMLTVQ